MDKLAIHQGFSIIEILIAMAIGLIVISGVVAGSGGFGSLVGGYQSTVSDSEIHSEALRKVQDSIEHAAATARANYSAVVSSTTTDCSGGLCYRKELSIPIAYAAQCQEAIASIVSWVSTQGRVLSVSATTTVVDVPAMLALGGDCDIGASDGWTKPSLFASYRFNPGQPTAIDVVHRVVYMPDDQGKLNIVDTNSATLGFSGDFISPPYDVGVLVNDIDVAVSTSTGERYAYVARHDTAKQFQIINVSDIGSPSPVASTSLTGVNPLHSSAQGWRVSYYDGYAYVATRYTDGWPEFHIFNVNVPDSPVEAGAGIVLDTSIYGIVIRDQFVSGTTHRFAYLVTTNNSKEVVVLDVTTPSNIVPITQAYTNIPGNKDGRSIYLHGTRIYIGLESGTGEDLYVLDASNPLNVTAGLPVLGKVEIGATVNAIRVSGELAFLATSKANDEFQVWNISNPETAITRVEVDPYNVPNKISKGIDIESPYLYAASQANDPLQILYSP